MAIHQEIVFKVSPEKLYRTLISSADFGKATNSTAEISANPGDEFSCFGGQISGRQIELARNQLIVQAWRAAPWSKGTYSIVRIDLEAEDDGTRLTMNQSGIPEGTETHLDAGWHKMYWQPLGTFFGNPNTGKDG